MTSSSLLEVTLKFLENRPVFAIIILVFMIYSGFGGFISATETIIAFYRQLSKRSRIRQKLTEIGEQYNDEAFISAASSGKVTATILFAQSPPTKESLAKAFLAAATAGEAQSVKSLLEGEAEIGTVDREQKNALMLAVSGKHWETVQLLLQAGANPNAADINGWTALHLAARVGCRQCVEMLIHHDTNVNARDKDGIVPIMWSAHFGNEEAIRMLAKAGADLNAKDNNGMSAIVYAVKENNAKAVDLLLEYGSDIKCVSEDLATPLIWAARTGAIDAAKVLLGRGADWRKKDNVGKDAWDYASAGKYDEILTELRNVSGDLGITF